MRKASRLLPAISAGLAFFVGTAVHGQSASQSAAQAESRFFQNFENAVYRGLEICQTATRDHGSFAPESFASEGWSIRSTGPKTNKEGDPYESIILRHYPRIELDVRRFPNHTTCSVMTQVLNLGHADRVQHSIEARWQATLHDEGELKAAVLESTNKSWGDEIDVRHYDLFYDDEFLFGAMHMLIKGSAFFVLDVEQLEHATLDQISDEERRAAREAASAAPVEPPRSIPLGYTIDESGESRILPPQPLVPIIRAVPNSVPIAKRERTLEEELGRAATTDELIAAVRVCMDAVSPQMEPNTKMLVDNGWGYTQPRQAKNEAGISFETVSYHKDNLSVILQDFGTMVQCRAGARISDLALINNLRSAMVDNLGATDAREIERLNPWVASIERGAPQTNFDNIFIAGNYSLEIFSRTMRSDEIEIDGAPTLHFVMISSVPLPLSYQLRAAN